MSECCCTSGGCCEKPVIPTVSTKLSMKDRLGGWKVRWGIGRMSYTVEPGIYAVGKPDENAPVLVSANYKLTFDSLRKELEGVDCWLLILDTKGVNVWCAAGKGSFGTKELLKRIVKTKLPELVAHKTLILPQLGAPGVNANEVKRKSGFSVTYGPVRAADIKAFLAGGSRATEAMRTVRFTLGDRLVVTPMELLPAARKLLYAFGVLFLLNLFVPKPFGLIDFIALGGAVAAGTVLTPLFLPILPGRAFSVKGGLLGLAWAAVAVLMLGACPGYGLILPAVSAYLAMNFTGTSTYTSPSGVLKEMKIALPVILGAAAIGSALVLIRRFL